MLFNPELLRLAQWRIDNPEHELEKVAFVPPGGGMPPGPGGDPAAGGAPGMDPGMGAPPPGMDAGMGMPPGGDPAAGAAPPPPAGGGGVDLEALRQVIRSEMQQIQGGGMGAAPGAAAGAGGKPVKADINTIATDCYQIKSLFTGLYNRLGWELPQNILDGPNRDPMTGLPMPQGAPGSTSDPNQQMQAAQSSQQQQPQSAIPPMEAMQGAFPQAPEQGGAPKTASDRELHMGDVSHMGRTINLAEAVDAILTSVRKKTVLG